MKKITQNDFNIALSTSLDTYNDKQGDDIQAGSIYLEYINSKEFTSGKSKGFKASVYKNPETDKFIISFRGTSKLSDINCNYELVGDTLPEQFFEAKKFIQNLSKDPEFNIQKEDIELITGHSKGGSFAQLIGSMKKYKDIKVVTINPYGVKHLFNDLQKEGITTSKDISNISNFGEGEDIIFQSSKQLGSVYSIDSDTSLFEVVNDFNQKDHNPLRDHLFENFYNDAELTSPKNISIFNKKELKTFDINHYATIADLLDKVQKDKLEDIEKDRVIESIPTITKIVNTTKNILTKVNNLFDSIKNVFGL